MKVLLSLVFVALLAGLGYWFFVSTPVDEQVPVVVPPAADATVEGVVTSLDFNQIAFDGPYVINVQDENNRDYVIEIPSMGLSLCAAVLNIAEPGAIAVGDSVTVVGARGDAGQVVPCEKASHILQVFSSYEDRLLGFEFPYKKGPNGYIVVPQVRSAESELVFGVTVFNREEYELLQSSTEAREAPPAMSISVYDNEENLSAPVWVQENPGLSNRELAIGSSTESVVGGANAERYTVDGLYLTDTYVVANGDYIYVLTGSYFDPESLIYQDFQTLVGEFEFVPTIGVAADIVEHILAKRDFIIVDSPQALATVTPPLVVSGQARGPWFFEATFPIVITDWDGLIIGEGFATAQGDWMTEEFVPFTGEISYSTPTTTISSRGTVIVQKSNASGLPENDDALEIPIFFE